MFVKGFRQRERLRPEIGIDLEGGCADANCHSVLCASEKTRGAQIKAGAIGARRCNSSRRPASENEFARLGETRQRLD